MTISKRTRFEVLRRDGHSCQYCGESAPTVKLHVDHVMPVSLGGSDYPDNLVAACSDCNSGKSSITPDSPLVEQVKGAAADFAVRSTQAAAKLRAEYEDSEEYVEEFHERWSAWAFNDTGESVPLPADWSDSVRQWWKIGVPEELIRNSIEIAMKKSGLKHSDHPRFRYMAGIVWTRLEQAGIGIDTAAEPQVYTWAERSEYGIESYEHGYSKGRDHGYSEASGDAREWIDATDFVARHIDGRPVLKSFPGIRADFGGVLSGT